MICLTNGMERVDGMTFDELKALLREWYEAGMAVNLGSMAGVDEWMDANFRLKTYARTLCEGAEVTE